MILDKLEGGELLHKIKAKNSYAEADATVIMRCVLEALGALH